MAKTKRLTFFLSILAVSVSVCSQNIEYITFNEDFSACPSLVKYVPLQAKSMRKSDNHGGQIKINYPSYPSSMPDSLMNAIEIATSLWEERLPVHTNFQIDVSYESNSTDMSVRVPYCRFENDTIKYASSYFQTYLQDTQRTSADGYVVFSDTAHWCCGYLGIGGGGQKSLSTAMLRAIAIVLGFGTSVRQSAEGAVYFEDHTQGSTLFEYLVFNDSNTPLSSIPKGTKRENRYLRNYIESSDTLWVKYGTTRHELFSGSPFVKDKSLIFLNDTTSLMHYEMPSGSRYMTIDSTTISILQAIGWEIETSPSASIYCLGIPLTGIASAYNSYLFEISNYVPNMDSLHWEYQVKTDSGIYQTVCQQADSLTFTFTPSTYLSSSHINPEGDIDGVVRLTYRLGGEEKTACKKLTFECAPKIVSVYDKTVHSMIIVSMCPTGAQHQSLSE